MVRAAPGCDHDGVAGRDLLESGSARSPSRVALRGRGWVLPVVLLVGLMVVLAARSSGRPAAVPVRRPVVALPAPVVRPPNYYLYDAAVANGRVYALAGFCVGRCGYRLLSWDGARWSSTRLTVPAGSASPGRLLVSGRYLTVLDGTRPGAYVSRDAGRTFTARRGRTGAPVAAVPPGLVADLGEGGVGVFDPVAGERHPLRTQPLREIRSVVTVGRSLYAVARQGTGLVVASSTDAGRSWRRTTVVDVPYRTPELALVAGTEGSAYLVVTRTLPAGEPGVVQVWRTAGRSWTRLVDYSRSISSTPKFTTAVGEPNGGILLADGSAGGQVVYDTGRSVNFQLPGGATGDPPLVPAVLRRGGSTVAAITADGGHLLVRQDHQAAWTVLQLPA
jgi:hypothetical protein